MKSYNLYIIENSVNLLREIQSYKWAEDRNGNTLDTPVKMNDHILDSLCYSIFIDIHKQSITMTTKSKKSSSFYGYNDSFLFTKRNKISSNFNNF